MFPKGTVANLGLGQAAVVISEKKMKLGVIGGAAGGFVGGILLDVISGASGAGAGGRFV